MSVDPVWSGCVVYFIWVESSTVLGGFRVLKRTSEAPYTTKVNYRDPTSRGPTQHCTPESTLRGGALTRSGSDYLYVLYA